MWDDAFKDAQEAIGQSESFDDLADFVESHAAECFGPLSALHAELLSPRYRLSFESLQDSVAEQMAQLQEAFTEIADATACDATDRIDALGVLPEIQEAAHTALSDHIESLKGPIAGDLELVSASELVRLQPGLICGAGAFAQESPLAAIQAMLKELELDSGVSSNGVLGITGLDDLTALPSVSSALADTGFRDSYLDDLHESICNLYAEELEHLKRTLDTALPKPAQLPTWRDYTPALGVAPNVDLEKLGARHGMQFTVKELLVYEAVARTAQRLLSMRDRRKNASKLGYIRWAASFGSKLLRLYVGLLFILWHLLAKDLLTTQKLSNRRLRRFVKCLSPPPVQPLSRLPKVKPNAPNVAA